MRAIIIEDNLQISKMINTLVSSVQDIDVLSTATSVKDAIQAIQQGKPELVFMDIELEDGLSFEILEKISSIDFKIIFITSFQEYAVKAFRYSAIDYVTKPIDPDVLFEAIDKARASLSVDSQSHAIKSLLYNINQTNVKDKKIVLNTTGEIYVVKPQEIIRIESEENYTWVYLIGKKVFVSKTLKEFEETLKDFEFVRIHKSHLINLAHLDRFDKKNGIAHLNDNAQIPISARNQDRLLKLIRDTKSIT